MVDLSIVMLNYQRVRLAIQHLSCSNCQVPIFRNFMSQSLDASLFKACRPCIVELITRLALSEHLPITLGTFPSVESNGSSSANLEHV